MTHRNAAGDMLTYMGTDAAKWAEQWVAICQNHFDEKGHPYPDHVIDEGWMISWFANAIEAGRTAGFDKGYNEGYDQAVRDEELV